MAVFKKNIWTLYVLIVLLTLILFSAFGLIKWQTNRDDFTRQQHMQLELFSNSIESLLTSQEALLEVVGHQLLQQSDFTRTAAIQIRPILDKLLDTHPAIAAFGLINPKGEYLAVSSNLMLTEQRNLLDYDYTRDSFLEAIESQKMVLGRTYFQDSLGTLIIPIRKSISTNGTDVAAVMTAGLKLNSTILFKKNVNTAEYNSLSLLRDDLYRQFYSKDVISLRAYSSPVDSNMVENIAKSFAKSYNIKIQDAKESGKIYSAIVEQEGNNSIVTTMYLNDYKL